MKFLNYSDIAKKDYPWQITEKEIFINEKVKLTKRVRIKSERINDEVLLFRKLTGQKVF